jgi:hypothetical protein
MHAMNGSGRRMGIRRYWRMVGCVAAAVGLSAMMLPSVAAAREMPTVKSTYLSLGDSLAFGFSEELFNNNLATGDNPADFEHGFDNDYFSAFNAAKHGRVQLVNDGCPGETSASLIGDGPELAAIKAVMPGVTGEAPCAYHTADHLPLHHEYGGTKSQLESALETIATDQAAGTPVKVISLDIGANDELHVVAAAEKQAKLKIEEFVFLQVIGQAIVESGGMEPLLKERVEALAGAYAEDHAAELLEKGTEDALAIIKADTPALFAQIDTNVTGILIAIRDAGYRGKVIFEAAYDAYGRVLGVSVGHKELEPGFNAGAAELAALEERTLTKKTLKMKICYSDAETRFNPASVNETLPEEEKEEKDMAKWTNMANFTEFEYAVGHKLKYGEKVEVAPGETLDADGPDIHPTPEGYEEMANQMISTCGFK